MLLWMVLVLARESHFAKPSIGEGGAKNSRPFIVICPALTFFSEKVFQIFLNEFSVISQIFSVTLLGIVLIMSSAK